ncbi:MAG: hypothetical protein QW291_00060 [Thermofilaceae archaeon]
MDNSGSSPAEVHLKLVKEVRESVPKIIVNVAVIAMIWVFTKYVFIPLAEEYAVLGIPLPQLISLVSLVAVMALVLNIVMRGHELIDAIAAYLALEVGARKQATEEEVNGYRAGLRSIFYVLVVSLLFLIFKEFLNVFHPAISATILLLIAIWAVITLIRAGRAFSKLAEYYASEWASLLEKRLKTDESA